MKIIEGTPEEILEYQKANKPTLKPKVSLSDAIRSWHHLDSHWSTSKQQWIPIAEMDMSYIVNVIKKMCRENSNLVLLQDREFKSLILNLADKIDE